MSQFDFLRGHIKLFDGFKFYIENVKNTIKSPAIF
jgi:hypothetical protein